MVKHCTLLLLALFFYFELAVCQIPIEGDKISDNTKNVISSSPYRVYDSIPQGNNFSDGIKSSVGEINIEARYNSPDMENYFQSVLKQNRDNSIFEFKDQQIRKIEKDQLNFNGNAYNGKEKDIFNEVNNNFSKKSYFEPFQNNLGHLDTIKNLNFKLPTQGDYEVDTEKALKNQLQESKELVSDETFRILPGKVITNYELSMMDSLREIDPNYMSLLPKEEHLRDDFKKVAFEKKSKLLDRIFLDAVLGLNTSSSKLKNISPALGYYINRKISLGLGPNIKLDSPDHDFLSKIGSRSFFKYELLQRKVYFQAENLSHLNKSIDLIQDKSDKKIINHSFFVGGGYLFPISKTISLIY